MVLRHLIQTSLKDTIDMMVATLIQDICIADRVLKQFLQILNIRCVKKGVFRIEIFSFASVSS